MTETIHQFYIKRGLLRSTRLLTIDPLYIEMEGSISSISFPKEDIEGFRYSVSFLSFYFFRVSKTYTIELRNSKGKIMVIRMHSFFGIQKKQVEQLFIEIYNKIYDVYFNDMVAHYLQLLNSGLTYSLAGAMISNEGLVIKKDGHLIPWIRLGLTSYYQSCSLYDLSNASCFRSFDYCHDWNATVLRSIVEYKLQHATYELLK